MAEAGGEFVGPTQDRILALAKDVGVGTFPPTTTATTSTTRTASASTYSDTSPLGTAPPDPLSLADIAAVVAAARPDGVARSP